MKKIISLIMSLVMMTLCFTACEDKISVDALELVTKAQANLANAKALKQQVIIDMDMSQKIGDEKIDSKTVMDFEVDSIIATNSNYMNGVVEVSSAAMNFDMNLQAYTIFKDNEMITYTSVMEQWMKMVETDPELFEKSDYNFDLDANLNYKVKETTVKVDGVECYSLSVNLSGDEFKKIYESASSVGEDSTAGMDLDSVKDAKYELLINKNTGNIYKVSLSFSGKISDPETNMETEFKMNTEIIYKAFDHIDEIVVPQSVIDAAESVDDWIDDDFDSEDDFDFEFDDEDFDF